MPRLPGAASHRQRAASNESASLGDLKKSAAGGVAVRRRRAPSVASGRRAVDRYLAGYVATRALAESNTLEEAARKVLRAICESLDWKLGALWSVDERVGALVCHETWRARSARRGEFEAVSQEIVFPIGVGLPGRVWASRKPAWIPDVVKDSNFPRAPIAAKEGLHGAFGFPILLRGEVVGVMEFFSGDIRRPDRDLLNMMAAVGSQIGQFIDRKQAEEARARRTRQLAFGADVLAALTGSDNMQSMLQRCAEATVRQLDAALACIWTFDEAKDVLELQASAGLLPSADGEYSRIALGNSGIGRIARRRKPYFSNSLSEDAQFKGNGWMTAQGLAAFAGYPLALGDRLLGVMAMFSREELPRETREALGYMAHTIALGMERSLSEQALREAEERYRSIFENAVFGVFQTTPDGSFMSANNALARILGYASAEELLSSVTDIARQIHVDPDRRAEFAALLEENGSVSGFEAQAYRRDGSVIWISLSGRTVRNRRGTVIRYEGIVEDISERKSAEARQQFLAEAGTILVSSLDYGTTLSNLAQLCVPYLGDWCAVDIVDDSGVLEHVAVVHSDPERVESLRRLLERYPADAQTDPGLVEVLRFGRSIFLAEIGDDIWRMAARDAQHLEVLRAIGLKSLIAVPLTARGRRFGVLTVAMAESGRRYQQDDLHLVEDLGRRAGLAVDNALLFAESQGAQEDLRRAVEAKDEFLGLMSHELRTPITAIYGGSRMLRWRAERLDDESKSGILEDIERESERLYRMVENLLVLARLELGQEVTTEPVLAQRVVKKVAANFMQSRPSRVVEIHEDGELEPIAATPTYLEHVLRNLLSNADKYSPKASPVEVRIARGDGEARISVLDRGPGVPPEEAELIFERFYRSDRTAGRAVGIGMGLTVCKRMIEAQSGYVWARPRDGGGLEVGFTLPLYKEEARHEYGATGTGRR